MITILRRVACNIWVATLKAKVTWPCCKIVSGPKLCYLKSDFTTTFDKLLLCVQYLFGEHYPVPTGSCLYLLWQFTQCPGSIRGQEIFIVSNAVPIIGSNIAKTPVTLFAFFVVVALCSFYTFSKYVVHTNRNSVLPYKRVIAISSFLHIELYPWKNTETARGMKKKCRYILLSKSAVNINRNSDYRYLDSYRYCPLFNFTF